MKQWQSDRVSPQEAWMGVGRGASSLRSACVRGFLAKLLRTRGAHVRHDAPSPAPRHARAIVRNRQSFLPKILGDD